MTKRRPLVQYAKENPPKSGTRPWLTTIPEHEEVMAAYSAGVLASTIRKWLVEECGYPLEEATVNRVCGHLKRYGKAPAS